MFDFNPVPLTLPQSATSKLTFNMVMSMSVASLTLQQWAVALDLQTILPAKDQNATRISALEDHLQREHNDLLVALQQAAAATGASWLRFIVLIVVEGEASTVDFKSFSGASLLRCKKVTEHSKEIGSNAQKRISGIMECCDDCEGGGFKFKHFENFHLKRWGEMIQFDLTNLVRVGGSTTWHQSEEGKAQRLSAQQTVLDCRLLNLLQGWIPAIYPYKQMYVYIFKS